MLPVRHLVPSWEQCRLGILSERWGHQLRICMRGVITMSVTTVVRCFVVLVLVASLWGADSKAKTETVQGYVLDSACAFTKGLDKPISRDCALACAKAGSPLVILAANGTIYWPIAETTPFSVPN